MAKHINIRSVLVSAILLIFLFDENQTGCFADTLCPDDWIAFSGSCYFIANHESLSFHDAERFCNHYGAHLVHINDATENTFLKSFLSDMKEAIHWIGLTDEITEGIWKWYDTDEVATYTNWHNPTSEPNGGKQENCVYIDGYYQYNWIDAPCSWLKHPLCEKMDQDGTQVIGR